MDKVVFEGETVLVGDNETLLDALLADGHDVNFGCRSGSCHSCLLVSDDSVENYPVLQVSQENLSDEQKALNYVLACQCFQSIETKRLQQNGSNDISAPPQLRRPDQGRGFQEATITRLSLLKENVLALSIKADLDYHAGQYVQMSLDEKGNSSRCYSLASQPNLDNDLRFHIKVIPDGEFSQRLANSTKIGDRLYINGPLGDCIYQADPSQPLLLAAIGTGLAPIYGILIDALYHNHYGKIHLCIGAKTSSDFYFYEKLIKLAKDNSQVRLHFITLEKDKTTFEFLHQGNIYDYVKENFSNILKESKIYLCGADSFVRKMRRQCFMSGASMSNIKADAFLPS